MILRWLRRCRGERHTEVVENLKGLVGVAVGVGFLALFLTGWHRSAPPLVHKLFLGFVIFYFGSR